MYFLYDLAVRFSWLMLQIAAFFNPKIRHFVRGRKESIPYLQSRRNPEKPLIWMHTASLGEFEQGMPVFEKLHAAFPDHQFLVTFFSPSGYEVKKHRLHSDLVTYLPMDTRPRTREFIRTIRPEIALFVKYEVWPRLFKELHRQDIPILMLSAIFRPRQAYFKWYGGFLRKALIRVAHFYVQDDRSAELLASIGLEHVTVSGDTRFDRVLEILESPRELEFMDRFRGQRTCLAAGSTWPEDHELLIPFINQLEEGACFVIAPHKIDPKTLENLQNRLEKETVLYSNVDSMGIQAADVLIIDTIGLLTKIYGYADIAYVGGGFATGLHNTLEPAVYGIPVLCGPQYHKFREAEELVDAGGIVVVKDPGEFQSRVTALIKSPEARKEIGQINTAYIRENDGASDKIMSGIL
ncbi:MAG: glycosyltransferase N-terminal domain-containing protein, partial [Robiginitalea sp.]